MTTGETSIEFQTKPESEEQGLSMRQLSVSSIPVFLLAALAFGYGYSNGKPEAADPAAYVTSVPASVEATSPEAQRVQGDLSGTVVKAQIRSHLERHACLSQVQFTTVELETAGGANLEAMLPLQITSLESAQKLFPTGKVESFRLSKVENIKSVDGSDLYAITDAALQRQ